MPEEVRLPDGWEEYFALSNSLDHIHDSDSPPDPHLLLCEIVSCSLGIPCVARLVLRMYLESWRDEVVARGETFPDIIN
jgi:hypothetical protein